MARLDLYNREEQHCPVCGQAADESQQTIEAHEILFLGAATYAWCPHCSRQVPEPWDSAYKVRWAEAFARRCREHPPAATKPGVTVWRLIDPGGRLVEARIADTADGYALEWRQDGEEQAVDRFASRESVMLRAAELKRQLLEQGFVEHWLH